MVFILRNTPPAEINDSAETIYVCTDLPSVMLKSTDFSAQKNRGKLGPNRTAAPVKASCVPGHLPLYPRSLAVVSPVTLFAAQFWVLCDAGNEEFRCRSRRFASQVRQISVACLRFSAERGRRSASGAFQRRESGVFCGPATQRHPTCDAKTPNRVRKSAEWEGRKVGGWGGT